MPAEFTPSTRGKDGNEDHSRRSVRHVFALVGAVSACRAAVASRLETIPNERPDARAWNYVAVGTGPNVDDSGP